MAALAINLDRRPIVSANPDSAEGTQLGLTAFPGLLTVRSRQIGAANPLHGRESGEVVQRRQGKSSPYRAVLRHLMHHCAVEAADVLQHRGRYIRTDVHQDRISGGRLTVSRPQRV